MEHFHTPAVTLALAMLMGTLSQAVARHVGLPGIIVLLATGVLLGPDAADLIRPEALGEGLQTLVGFAVAVILFEGGLNLDVARLRRQGKAIRRLITVGALLTLVGGTLSALVFMGWGLRESVLFGTLVIVTGPTVITPLLRRLRVEHKVATVLEAEGVLIDAVGAITATIALEVALQPTALGMAEGALHIVLRLGFGVLLGLVVGALLALLLRYRRVVPEGLENVLTLSTVLALFQISNAILHESGLAAATVAGVVVGNSRSPVSRELADFKEQLTVLLIGMLFVLLAADVRLATVAALGLPGALVVATLVLFVRPLNVFVSCHGTDLDRRRKLFLSWIGPRGIVAAAVASFFAVELEGVGVAEAESLRALVFLVIAVTVLLSGLTGGAVARALGLRRRTDHGWIIAGANEVGVELGKALSAGGDEVVVIDLDPGRCEAAGGTGLRVVTGDAHDERTLQQVEVDTRRGAIGVTENEEVNLIFARRAKQEGRLHRIAIALEPGDRTTPEEMLERIGGELLFGRREDVAAWSDRLRDGAVDVRRFQLQAGSRRASELQVLPVDAILPLARRRGRATYPVTDTTLFKSGDLLTLLVERHRAPQIEEALALLGWSRADATGTLATADRPPGQGGEGNESPRT